MEIEHLKIIKSQRKKLFDFAVKEPILLKLMLAEKMFKLEDIPILLEKVTEVGNTEIVAMLLEYREIKFSEEEKQRFQQK